MISERINTYSMKAVVDVVYLWVVATCRVAADTFKVDRSVFYLNKIRDPIA